MTKGCTRRCEVDAIIGRRGQVVLQTIHPRVASLGVVARAPGVLQVLNRRPDLVGDARAQRSEHVRVDLLGTVLHRAEDVQAMLRLIKSCGADEALFCSRRHQIVLLEGSVDVREGAAARPLACREAEEVDATALRQR